MANDYPKYSVTYKSKTADGTIRQIKGQDELKIDGSHRFQLTTATGRIEVDLRHHDEDSDRVPQLVITFTDVA